MMYREIYGLIQKTCTSLKITFSELCSAQKSEYIRVKYCLIFFLWLKGQLTEQKLAEIFGYAKGDATTISYALTETGYRISKWAEWKFCYERIEYLWEKCQTFGGDNKFCKNPKLSFEEDIRLRELNNQLVMF